jgi:3-hydroxyisobutyrate dehydrogenase-like beta-hydroxyacid dehydrogenase
MTFHSGSIAFLGTGLMGARQARRLLDAGWPLTAWNRSREKADALAPLGARVEGEAADAVREAEFVVLMLENGRIVEEVLFGRGVPRRCGRAASSST